MSLEISGKLLHVLPEQSGTGKTGTSWVKQDFVIETSEQYPKKVCISAWGEKASAVKKLTAGSTVKVAFSVESREYNGKWYTDVRAINIESSASSETSETVQTEETPMPDLKDELSSEPKDDLPF